MPLTPPQPPTLSAKQIQAEAPTKLASIPRIETLLFILLTLPPAHAQLPEPTLPTYDVVTIKPDNRGPGSMGTDIVNNTFTAGNISLRDLLQDAYHVRKDLISGIPGPVDSARFDIVAKTVDPEPGALKNLTPRQRGEMMLPILADRFQLKTHTEIRILPVYELVLIDRGPKFQPSPEADAHNSSLSIHNRSLTARNLPMASLAVTLSDQIHRTVLDKTGLAGGYDFTLEWSSDNPTEGEADTAPSIFTALQEQLGLKLQPAKGPVETLVVDHVEMPSAN